VVLHADSHGGDLDLTEETIFTPVQPCQVGAISTSSLAAATSTRYEHRCISALVARTTPHHTDLGDQWRGFLLGATRIW
jgi:hypothetical protein